MSGELHSYCAREEIHLPNEILAIIINNIASDTEDKDRTLEAVAALASCRLASHVLCSLATPLLFSSIQLVESIPAPWESVRYNPGFRERVAKLKEILTTNDIAASVHTLELHFQPVNLDWTSDTLISVILHRLPHLRTFIFKSGRMPLKFTALRLEQAIKSLCRSPNLTTLELGNIVYFPISFIIDAGPNLQCLRLSEIQFHFNHPYPIDPNLQPYNLDSLEIDEPSTDSLGAGMSGLFGDIPLSRHFSRIKNLRLKDLFYDSETFKNGWDIMVMASQSLTTLDLLREKGYRYPTTFPAAFEGGPFDLGRFPALRDFKIEIRLAPGDNVSMLSFLNQLLSISSCTSRIETLEIIITWEVVDSGYERDLFASDVGWSMLDKSLSSEKFASLQKIVFGLFLESRWGFPSNLELGRSLTLPYINALFPMFRALISAQRTLELHFEITLPDYY